MPNQQNNQPKNAPTGTPSTEPRQGQTNPSGQGTKTDSNKMNQNQGSAGNENKRDQK
ncbi:MAG: hypothetical protein AB7O96_07535 [Pseudobdellovibrionaceae bacterium]